MSEANVKRGGVTVSPPPTVPERRGHPTPLALCAINPPPPGEGKKAQSTKITRISFTFVNVGPGSKRSPVASKNVVASLLSR